MADIVELYPSKGDFSSRLDGQIQTLLTELIQTTNTQSLVTKLLGKMKELKRLLLQLMEEKNAKQDTSETEKQILDLNNSLVKDIDIPPFLK